ncbi:hypothetical protein RCG19_13555 [Neobacillus sp. OS1-2]|uniref:hypothetical protein n=1 Tax=Neobacillus sp. OS1-2 TaxID=3070680 RepID=UPI0027E150CE|nr:hypothetical protein [Neobacillus sp. OS1-2]WML38249.1 hypothetical protein RCG19_13555 [Neobacillus sp. OS1-2]
MTESLGKPDSRAEVSKGFIMINLGGLPMKKKWITAGTGLGIGAVLLLVSGFSAMANTNGYDAYKTALKNMKAKTSITTNVDLTITDNGKKLVTGAAIPFGGDGSFRVFAGLCGRTAS